MRNIAALRVQSSKARRLVSPTDADPNVKYMHNLIKEDRRMPLAAAIVPQEDLTRMRSA